ncbi:Non-specific ribonucleoside hydrolase RihC [Morella rubra]|uniref:Non-specific ribonucleoside hydrolase RihC n=1 Tax=Morella rubra TaxID=262757 RepID=A0A6A1VQC6_9ROSI|nr:Non-specific ribonucleoside hydrolase RihC [Morella rubra]
MGRDDIPVGVGGEGGILEDGDTTVGYCKYRQAVPIGQGGRLDIDANYGIRKAFLPQGRRMYTPLRQPTAQQVMIDTISAGPTTVFVIGAHTNFAIFLMNNRRLKKNIEHIYVMGGGVRSKNPTGCCPKNASSSCVPQQCGDHGNLFTDYTSNPYAEFNIFGDPFAAYQVFHSGIPITLVPLDATNTIPINENFFDTFEQSQNTYEAQYCFESLKITRDTWFDNQFYTSYFMWDSFTSGVATSIMRNSHNHSGENEFAEMEYMNITVVTSNKPYGVSKFNLKKGGDIVVMFRLDFEIHLHCKGKGECQDGYTAEVTGPEAVRVLVATKAKPNLDVDSPLNREFYKSFLDALNRPLHTGRFNFTTQFPYYKEVLYKPDFGSKRLGKPVVFDMDMSAGDFSLSYTPESTVEVINISCWRLQIQQAIPYGSGGLLDSDTLYGLARDLPRSPRRYTAQNSVKYGAPRDTDHPELRQPLALEVWQTVVETLDPGAKITILTNGPLTNLAKIILSKTNTTSLIQDVYIVGGHISRGHTDKGNVFTVPSNEYAEFNMFLDPLAAKTVFDSELNITLIPLGIQRRVGSFPRILERFQVTKMTPEAKFGRRLLSRLYRLQQMHTRYQHMGIFSGEILGALALAGEHSSLQPTLRVWPIKVFAEGVESQDGQTVIDEKHGKLVKVLENVNPTAYYNLLANQLGNMKQSAVIGSSNEQRRIWSRPPK